MNILTGSPSLILVVLNIPGEVSTSPAVQRHCLLCLCSSFIFKCYSFHFPVWLQQYLPRQNWQLQLESNIMEKQLNESFTAQLSHFHCVIQLTVEKMKLYIFFKHIVRSKLLFFPFPCTKCLDGIFCKGPSKEMSDSQKSSISAIKLTGKSFSAHTRLKMFY